MGAGRPRPAGLGPRSPGSAARCWVMTASCSPWEEALCPRATCLTSGFRSGCCSPSAFDQSLPRQQEKAGGSGVVFVGLCEQLALCRNSGKAPRISRQAPAAVWFAAARRSGSGGSRVMNHRLSVNRRDRLHENLSGQALGLTRPRPGPAAEGSAPSPWTAERFHQATEPGRHGREAAARPCIPLAEAHCVGSGAPETLEPQENDQDFSWFVCY